MQYLTVNGPVQVRRTVYWNRQQGSVTPVGQWLGMSQGRYSVGVRQMCCREAADSDFCTAAEDLAYVGQLAVSPETVRGIVQSEGREVLRRRLRATGKRQALAYLRKFIAARREMTQYPQFRAAGYEIGSGPAEAFCKTLTSRLKGQGMRWDKPNAEAMMALAPVRSRGLWQAYWDTQRKIPA